MNATLLVVCAASSIATFTASAAPPLSQIEREIQAQAQGTQRARARADTETAIEGCVELYPLAESPTLDERIAWTSRMKRCLSAVEKSLEVELYGADDASRVRVLQERAGIASLTAALGETQLRLDGEQNFLKMTWGVAVGYSYGFDDVVEDAEVVDGTVRVKKELREQPRLLFEFHRYFACHPKRGRDVRITTGCGPFVGVATGDGDALAGVAIGGMFGWKTPQDGDKEGFSIGLGLLLDAEGKTLADRFDDGQPLPDGATEIVFEDKARWSGVLFFTRTF